MNRSLAIAAVSMAVLLAAGGAFADPDELMPCKLVLIKAPPAAGGSGLTKFVCKPPPGGAFALPSPEAAPTASSLRVGVNTVPPGNSAYYPTACTGLGNPAGSTGYKCQFLPIAIVLIRTNVVKVIAKFDLPETLGATHPYTGDLAIQLVSEGGMDTKNYCARFPLASAVRNDASQFKAKDAPAPTVCSPSGAFVDGDGGIL